MWIIVCAHSIDITSFGSGVHVQFGALNIELSVGYDDGCHISAVDKVWGGSGESSGG
jgi:hypothetical protein